MCRATIVFLTISILLAGCANGTSGNQNTLAGGAIGAVGGGAIGALVARRNPALGALVGAGVGGAAGALIGRQLDVESERRRQEAMQRAAAIPMQPAEWTGKDAGTSGRVQFRTRPARSSGGRTCAMVQETILIGGQPQQADRQTCRSPDGTWT